MGKSKQETTSKRIREHYAFHHKVHSLSNDFHSWIRNIYQDTELADEILKARTPAAAAAVIGKHVQNALAARQEIESAIARAQSQAIGSTTRKAVALRSASKIVAKAVKRKAKTAAQKRKVNKRTRKLKGAKRIRKKKVNRWLNWLKLAPEL
ncbi:hypothetical protein HYU18_00590 [Candidatus Woesearchaeota archaeon]|nr:hypothetical protein [Candidatus Woesearchaeota archaeon]